MSIDEIKSFGDVMLFLQQNYFYGMIIFSCIIILLYIGVSLLCVRVGRKSGYFDVCVIGFIPCVNLLIPVLVFFKNLGNKKTKRKVSKYTKEVDNLIMDSVDDEELF